MGLSTTTTIIMEDIEDIEEGRERIDRKKEIGINEKYIYTNPFRLLGLRSLIALSSILGAFMVRCDGPVGNTQGGLQPHRYISTILRFSNFDSHGRVTIPIVSGLVGWNHRIVLYIPFSSYT